MRKAGVKNTQVATNTLPYHHYHYHQPQHFFRSNHLHDATNESPNQQRFFHDHNQRNSSLDILSKRISMNHQHSNIYSDGSMMADEMLLPSFSFSDKQSGGAGMLDCSIQSYSEVKKRPLKGEDLVDLGPKWKKRRLSSLGLGFLSPSAFVDEDSEASKLQQNSNFVKEVDDKTIERVMGPQEDAMRRSRDLGPVDGDREEDTEDEDDDDQSTSSPIPIDPIRLDTTRINFCQMTQAMRDFSTAMEKSQKSQQDIHDWDRKMGLKRSHSKTMRLSSRSRKQLRAILKAEINSMIASASANKS